MIFRAFIITCVLGLASCMKPPESSTPAGIEFKVDKLFTHEGCTVYRFNDGGIRYFTNCSGATSWIENCGKNCSKNVGVN